MFGQQTSSIHGNQHGALFVFLCDLFLCDLTKFKLF
jgi:hypothetical protein